MDDKMAIEQVVKNYRDGSFTADEKLFSSVFKEDGLVSGFVGEKDMVIPAPVFVDLITHPEDGKTTQEKGCDFRCEVTDVVVDGPIAHCRFLEFDDDGTDYVTYFQLMKLEEGWKVVSKLFVTV